MAISHTLVKLDRGAPITLGKAYDHGSMTLNFGETASVVLTQVQLAEALALIQAAIDEHMARRPAPLNAA